MRKRKRKEQGQFVPDEGYYFGLGAFETIAVENGVPRFIKEHLERLAEAMETLGISQKVTKEQVTAWLSCHPVARGALKISVSEKNVRMEKRENHYTPEMYEHGFCAAYSSVLRNSTSPFTYMKSLNCADLITEKRRAAREGVDEPIFLNERGEICEGAVSNVFFVQKSGRVITPAKTCGLLPGVVRRLLLEHKTVSEAVIRPEDVPSFKEAFITNSLMGIMPLNRLGNVVFEEREITEKLMAFYICL